MTPPMCKTKKMSAPMPPNTRRNVATSLLALVLVIALLLALSLSAEANPVANPIAHTSSDIQASQSTNALSHSSGDFNNLDTLISDLFEDRLKKNKQHSVRQIKQTMRFGRRSDPMMMPASDLEREGLFDQGGGRNAVFED